MKNLNPMKNTIICGLLVFSAVVYSQNDYKPINLGNSINSKYDELRPLISPDGKTLYFIRANHPQNTYENLNTEEAKKQKGSQDIWCSNLDKDNNWSEPKHLDKPFNQRRNNTVFSITPDGNTMLVRGVYENGVFVQDGFSLSQKEANGWGPFQKLDIPDFDILCLGNYYGGYLSNDNEVLVMYFSEIEGEDNSDIYVSLKKKDGTWSAPKKLKNGISSKSDEIAPILAPDGKTLYFASDRQGGFGSYDIYKTERLDDTYEKWSEPVNLGPTINSTESEKYYSIDASGNFAFMITSKNSAGGSDIVKIKLKEENKPKPVALVSGKVINKKTNLPMHATIHSE